MNVAKAITVRLISGIRSRAASGKAIEKFHRQLGADATVGLTQSMLSEASIAARQVRDSADGMLRALNTADWQFQRDNFNTTYVSLLPKGGINARVEGMKHELELGLWSFAVSVQDYLRMSPDAVTAVIDVRNFNVLLQNTLDRILEAARDLKTDSLKTILPQKIIEAKYLAPEDHPKASLFLEQAKVKGQNIYEWLDTWWLKCSVFQATDEERSSLGLNALAEIFYGESGEDT